MDNNNNNNDRQNDGFFGRLGRFFGNLRGLIYIATTEREERDRDELIRLIKLYSRRNDEEVPHVRNDDDDDDEEPDELHTRIMNHYYKKRDEVLQRQAAEAGRNNI